MGLDKLWETLISLETWEDVFGGEKKKTKAKRGKGIEKAKKAISVEKDTEREEETQNKVLKKIKESGSAWSLHNRKKKNKMQVLKLYWKWEVTNTNFSHFFKIFF